MADPELCARCTENPRTERQRLCASCQRADGRALYAAKVGKVTPEVATAIDRLNRERAEAKDEQRRLRDEVAARAAVVAWRSGPVTWDTTGFTSVMMCDRCPQWGTIKFGEESGLQRATMHARGHGFDLTDRVNVPEPERLEVAA
jgi:hypothetical protein